LTSGARIVVVSDVPEGKGVSSSAAVETATMAAMACAFGIALEPRDLALLCQTAENRVAGAPCGVMDQMTCVFGDADQLMALLCQPAELQVAVPVPDDIELWGLDSGERHAVGGSDYGAVRTGAFMGLRILLEHTAVPGEYLANIAVDHFEQELARHLPEHLSGDEFLARYGSTADSVTSVERGRLRALPRRGVSPAAARIIGRGPPTSWRADVRVSRRLWPLWARLRGDRSPRRAGAQRRSGGGLVWRADHGRGQRRYGRRNRPPRGHGGDRARGGCVRTADRVPTAHLCGIVTGCHGVRHSIDHAVRSRR
jgi:hypothetical protein